MKEKRDYFNNLKTILIFLVVIGHFLINIQSNCGHAVNFVLIFIYLFHMPAFVFVTGFFSKSFVKRNDYERTQKLLGYLILYIAYTLALIFVRGAFTHIIGFKEIFYVSSAPWYLLATVFWMTMLISFRFLKPVHAIALAVFVAIMLGFFDGVNRILAISRTLCFFPFFLAGYYCDAEIIGSIRNRKMQLLSAVGFIVFGVVVYNNLDFVNKYSDIIYAEKSYVFLPTGSINGALLRLLWFAVSSILILFIIELIPNRKFRLNYIGRNTIGIYIFHRLITEVIYRVGVYDLLPSSVQKVVFVIVASCVICLVFGMDIFDRMLRKVFCISLNPDYEKKQ